MVMQVKPIPAGYHTLTPDLIVKDVSTSIEFYKKAFNAQEIFRCNGSDGKVMHAEIQIGDSRLMLCGECSESGCVSPGSQQGNSCRMYVYVENVDSVFDQAVKAGGKVLASVKNMFWVDRTGELLDPSGHRWLLATHKEELTPQQITERSEAFFASLAKTG